TILGVIVLIVGVSLLYDFLVKPGITNVGRFLLDVITLGSKSIRDSAYSSAALNPTPLSALIILFGVFYASLMLAGSLSGRKAGMKSGEREAKKILRQVADAPDRDEKL